MTNRRGGYRGGGVTEVTSHHPHPVPFLHTFLFQFNQSWQLIVPETRTLYFSSSDRQYNINCTFLTIYELNIECPEKRCVLSIFMTCSPLRPLRFCRIVLQNAGNAMSGSLDFKMSWERMSPEPQQTFRAFGARQYHHHIIYSHPPWKNPISATAS